MKHLLLTTALIAAGAAGSATAEAHMSESPFATEMKEGQVHASDFIGMRVYAAAESGEMTEVEGVGDNWEDIGEINDVIMSRDGQVQNVLVDIGGFLGMGERQVAVNLDQIQFVSDNATEQPEDFYLVLNADPATLEEAPEFKVERTAERAAADVERTAENAGQEVESEDKDAMNGVQATANATANREGVTGNADVERTEETDMAAEEGELTDTDTAEVDTNANPTVQTDSADAAPSNFAGTPVEETYLTAENLDGARVYDANDEWVGEISELIVSEDGKITDAIIDIGGFLGIGEKPVAMKLTDLQILRQDGGDDVRIYTAMAEADLEAMPEFEKK